MNNKIVVVIDEELYKLGKCFVFCNEKDMEDFFDKNDYKIEIYYENFTLTKKISKYPRIWKILLSKRILKIL